MRQTTLRIEEHHDEFADEAIRASVVDDYLPDVTDRAPWCRYLMDCGLRALFGSEEDVEDLHIDGVDPADIAELIPDSKIAYFRVQSVRDEGSKDLEAADTAGRFERIAESFFEGNFKPAPGSFEAVGEDFVEEVDVWEDLGYLEAAEAARQREAIRAEVDRRIAMLDDAEAAPDVREPPTEVSVGRGIKRLQDESEAFLEAVRELAETEHFSDPDALRRALSSKFAVEVEVVDHVLDELTEDGVDGRAALKAINSDELPESFVDDPALEDVDETEPVDRGPSDDLETVQRDHHVETLGLRDISGEAAEEGSD